ncbi:PP2C family protein-serine/threonine phosphatase [Actinoallomurus oryzae]|uniref:PP2C family protein-serine/threonine phosphatase n=1 Tax=Actinoallomurus oryzae TaxID=502180 RepID=A0ABP8QXH2_9ACTN
MRWFGPAALPGTRIPRQALIAIPVLLVLAVPAIDHVTPAHVHLAPTLFVAAAMTATFASALVTALVGVGAVAALIVAALDRGTLATEDVTVQLVALTVLSGFMVLFCHLRERYERDLVRVRSISKATQRVVLRPLPERSGPVSIASAYHAAEADTDLGGDLYAVTRAADSTRLLIGDVRGKGLASISDTAIMLEAFRASARRRTSLQEMAADLEESICWGMVEFSGAGVDAGERFVTAVMVDIPDDEPVVRLISLGHPPPLLLHHGKASPLQVSNPAPPFGLGDLSDDSYAVEAFPFGMGDLLLLYTDGLTEARNLDRTFYPLAQRAAAWSDCDPQALIQKIAADLAEYVPGALCDDMAMIAVRREKPPAAGAASPAPRSTGG